MLANIIIGAILCNLFWIAYQDFKTREILLLSYFSLIVLLAIYFTYFKLWNLQFIPNLGLLALLGVTITIINYVKTKSFNITQSFAWGDILLLVITAFVVHISTLLLLIIFSAITAILFHQVIFKKSNKEIPYAGYFALTLLSLIGIWFWGYQKEMANPFFYTIFD